MHGERSPKPPKVVKPKKVTKPKKIQPEHTHGVGEVVPAEELRRIAMEVQRYKRKAKYKTELRTVGLVVSV
jgi:hypothetical protein